MALSSGHGGPDANTSQIASRGLDFLQDDRVQLAHVSFSHMETDIIQAHANVKWALRAQTYCQVLNPWGCYHSKCYNALLAGVPGSMLIFRA